MRSSLAPKQAALTNSSSRRKKEGNADPGQGERKKEKWRMNGQELFSFFLLKNALMHVNVRAVNVRECKCGGSRGLIRSHTKKRFCELRSCCFVWSSTDAIMARSRAQYLDRRHYWRKGDKKQKCSQKREIQEKSEISMHLLKGFVQGNSSKVWRAMILCYTEKKSISLYASEMFIQILRFVVQWE